MSDVSRSSGQGHAPSQRRSLPPLVILCDTREQKPPPFPEGVVIERATLGEADYTTRALRTIAVIERKSVSDFASSITWQRDRFDREIERLRPYKFKSIVVEGEFGEVLRASSVHPNAVIGSIASFYARAGVPTFFVTNPTAAGRLIAGILRRLEEDFGAPAAATEGAA